MGFWCEDLNFQYGVIKINIEKLELLLLPDGTIVIIIRSTS